MEHDANGLRILSRQECLALLAPGGLGRVALSHRALPVILPVSFGLLDDEIVFEASEGFLLRAATRNDVVCFETDAADVATASAWSVVVTGQLVPVDEPATVARAAQVEMKRWLPRSSGTFLMLPTTMVSGRHTPSDPVGPAALLTEPPTRGEIDARRPMDRSHVLLAVLQGGRSERRDGPPARC